MLKNTSGVVPAAQSGHRHDPAVVRRGDRGVAAAAGAGRGRTISRARAAAASGSRVRPVRIVTRLRLHVVVLVVACCSRRAAGRLRAASRAVTAGAGIGHLRADDPRVLSRPRRARSRSARRRPPAVHAGDHDRARGAGGVGQPRAHAAEARRAGAAAEPIERALALAPDNADIVAARRPDGSGARAARRGGSRGCAAPSNSIPAVCARASRWPTSCSASARPKPTAKRWRSTTSLRRARRPIWRSLLERARLAAATTSTTARLRDSIACVWRRSAGLARAGAGAAQGAAERCRRSAIRRRRCARRRSCATCWRGPGVSREPGRRADAGGADRGAVRSFLALQPPPRGRRRRIRDHVRSGGWQDRPAPRWWRCFRVDAPGAHCADAANLGARRIACRGRSRRRGASSTAPGPRQRARPLDWNHDFRTDLVMADAGGVRLLLQARTGTFTDVTATARRAQRPSPDDAFGVWPADIEMDGDIDLVVGATTGPPSCCATTATARGSRTRRLPA